MRTAQAGRDWPQSGPGDTAAGGDNDVGGAAFVGPLFDALRPQLDLLQGRCDLAALNARARQARPPVSSGGGKPLRFVAASRPGGMRLSVNEPHYEERAYSAGEVETRPGNWHDAFNALAWLAWPRSKAALNALHVRELRSVGATARRSVARDVATLFDEGGAVIACSDPSLAALVEGFRWKDAFFARRADVIASMRCYLFGHSLFDKARAPYKAMTAHVLIFAVPLDFFSQPLPRQIESLDARIAAWFANPGNLGSTSGLAPLPLLGFPGFCDANAQADFYDDAAVFRNGRMRSPNLRMAR